MSKTYYTSDHEWITVDGEQATVGITDYAQEQLGDLVFVELPDVGKTLAKGEDAIVVESVKAASDVYAPVSGDVTAINDNLSDDPALINRAAESDGWLIKIKIGNMSELDELMDADAYKASIA